MILFVHCRCGAVVHGFPFLFTLLLLGFWHTHTWQEKDLTTNDGPVKVKTLAKEELHNGEEGEETVYTVPKMKLFELGEAKKAESDEKKEGEEDAKDEKKEPAKKVWHERGLGVLRVNVDKETHLARVLIRREPTHQSMANFNIIPETKVTVDAARKSVTVQTIEPDTAEDSAANGKEDGAKAKGKISFYLIRVSTKEIAEELGAKISEYIKKEEAKPSEN